MNIVYVVLNHKVKIRSTSTLVNNQLLSILVIGLNLTGAISFDFSQKSIIFHNGRKLISFICNQKLINFDLNRKLFNLSFHKK